MNLIDGRKILQKILNEIKKEIEAENLNPRLAVVLVGNDPASEIYTRLKKEKAQKVGIRAQKHILSYNTKEKELIDLINELNSNNKINGILVQLPLPKSFSADKVIQEIDLIKDVDGLREESLFDSPFILGIWRAIQSTNIDLNNKKIIALVNSEIFGNKLKDFFKKNDIKIEYFLYSKSKKKLDFLRQADVLITACGISDLINSSLIKSGAILIDGGISRDQEDIKGDVDIESVSQKADWLTPTPGGLGPLTVAFLLKNVLKSYNLQHNNE